MRFYDKDAVKSALCGAADQGRLSHAVMFSGRRGSGRKFMARFAAQLFLCGKGGCGECVECRNIENDAHPDVLFVKAALGGKYAMEPLKEILRGTVIKPNNGDLKVYIFEDCDAMLPQHLNSLLKLIEEPAPHLRFIFTCENTKLIPETILSRVTEYEIPDTSEESCREFLINERGLESGEAAELSRTFSGNIGDCLAVLAGGDDKRLVDIAKKAGAALAKRSGYGVLAALSEPKDRAECSRVYDLFAKILRDALALSEGADAEFFARGVSASIAESFTADDIILLLDTIFEISANEIYNINTALSAAYFVSAFGA